MNSESTEAYPSFSANPARFQNVTKNFDIQLRRIEWRLLTGITMMNLRMQLFLRSRMFGLFGWFQDQSFCTHRILSRTEPIKLQLSRWRFCLYFCKLLKLQDFRIIKVYFSLLIGLLWRTFGCHQILSHLDSVSMLPTKSYSPILHCNEK